MAPTQQPVNEIIKNISDDVRILVQGEIELAKAELVPSAKNAGAGAGLFGVAGYFILSALSLLFIAGALGISMLGLNLALSFVIMAGVMLVIAAVLALIGVVIVKKIKGPERTTAAAKTSIESITGAIKRGNAAATARVIEAKNGDGLPSRELR